MLHEIADFLQRCLDFSKVLNASIAASWLILAVLFFCLLLKKAPKWTHVVLWGLVAVRLLLPFSIESALSLIPSKDTIPQEILRYEGNLLQEPAHLDVVSNPVYPNALHLELNQSVGRIQIKEMYMNFVWIGGMIVMLLYIAISYLCLRRRVRTAVLYRDNLFQSEHVNSPFVFGIIHPRIYLPFQIEEHHLEHVIAHEQAHIRRRDHWWKPLGFLLLTIHWFNPLMWLSYVLLCRDIELACDEKVIKALDHDQRADYSQALLSCSITRRTIAACPLAFGEVGVKKRVQNVFSYKKPAFWVVLVGIVAIVTLAVCFLTNPPEGENVKRKLTLEDVVKLSEKGEELVWEDLEEYEYIETGSGLYIRVYEIDERFSLFVGGWIEGDETLKPLYFYLMAQDESELSVDIRTADVEAFIREHKDNAVVKRCPTQDFFCEVGYEQEASSMMLWMAENKDKMMVSSIQHLPVIRVDSKSELDSFVGNMNGKLDFSKAVAETESFTNVVSFEEVLQRYEDDFFETNSLFLVYLTEKNDESRQRVDYVQKDGDSLLIGISRYDVTEKESTRDEAGKEDRTGWLIAIEVLRQNMGDVSEVDAFVSSVHNLESWTTKDRSVNHLLLAEASIDFGECKGYTFQYVMTEGEYYTVADVGPGGGIYEENYNGNCELWVLDSNGNVLDKINCGSSNYPGPFQLCVSDYNKDGFPDVTLGSYGSSNWNTFELYTIDSQGKIRNICENLSMAVGVKAHSIFLTQEEGSTDFYTSAWNNAIGQTETTRWVWDQEAGLYRKVVE